MDIKSVAITAVKKAGKILLELSKSNIRYEKKNKFDILAEGDLKSERIIIDLIKKSFPTHSILSEEKGEENNESEYFWIIDPVDGTINFSRKINEYCVSVAVEHEGELVLGVIYQPVLDRLYVAERGKGAFLNGKKLLVSNESKLINMLLSTDNTSSITGRAKNFGILARTCNKVRHIRVFGSSALHLAKIASGNLDIHFKSRFNYWDYAAGIMLVKEAGGKVTDFEGRDITKSSENVVVSNGKIHKEILDILND
ncbi:MAG: inositol monophosphatase [Candidatus Omnitrophica bacterium]|nr:inositol monophosphatase [Candidatus Omnitrophota bacterium]